MEQNNIFSERVRRLATAAGVASALALLPFTIFFLFFPALLLVGGMIQRRYPNTGRWLVWAGAANLSLIVASYDVVIFRERSPVAMVVIFLVATVLLVWCCAELVVDGIKKMGADPSLPPAETRPVSLSEWILAVILNLLIAWEAVGLVRLTGLNRHSDILYTVGMPLVQAVIVVVFDISLIRRVVKVQRARRANL
jgi:hypothetical protein